MSAYTLHGILVGSTYIPSGGATVDPGVAALVEGAGGSVDVTQAAVGGTKPVATFRTPALGTATGVCGASPVKLYDGTGGITATLYFAKMLNGSTYASTSVHTSVKVNNGMLVLTSIRGDKGAPAIAEYTVYATYDGTNSPYVVTANVALPAATLLAELYTVNCAVISYASTSKQVKLNSATLNVGNRESQERSAADTHPTVAALMYQEPTIDLETFDVKGMLDIAGVDPLVSTGTTLYFAKMDGPTVASGSVHLSIAANDPLVALSRISTSQGQVASATYGVHPIYQDATVPLTFSNSAALPTAESLNALFTIGPVEFNSVTFESTQWTYDTGLTITKESSKGDVYPTVAAVTKREPVFSGDVLDVDDSVVMFGLTEANAEVWLRKLDEGGTRVAEATAEHIQFLLVAALSFGNQKSGDWGATAKDSWTMRPVKSGVNAVVTIDTTAAISA